MFFFYKQLKKKIRYSFCDKKSRAFVFFCVYCIEFCAKWMQTNRQGQGTTIGHSIQCTRVYRHGYHKWVSIIIIIIIIVIMIFIMWHWIEKLHKMGNFVTGTSESWICSESADALEVFRML